MAEVLNKERKGDELVGARWLLLTLAVCQSCGGDWRGAVPAAAAIELFMTAGDLLDDIEDGDLVSASEAPQTVNIATSLVLLSTKAALRLSGPEAAQRVLRAISDAGVQSCAGQHDDLAFEAAPEVSEEAWLRMTELRCGSLAECACKVGAIVGGGDEAAVSVYAAFGRTLGVSGQITNDLHVMNSSSAKNDLARRKKTFPVIYALKATAGAERETLSAHYRGGVPETEDRIAEIRGIISRSGAYYYSTFVAEDYRLRAFQGLKDAGVSREVVSLLDEVVTLRG